MKNGDRVKFNTYPTGSPIEFYMYEANPDRVYEVDVIKHDDEVYLVGCTNYVRAKFLDVVEDV